MALILVGAGSYSISYDDENGTRRTVRIQHRHDVETLGLPDHVVDDLRTHTILGRPVFAQVGKAPERPAGYSGGKISMDGFKDLVAGGEGAVERDPASAPAPKAEPAPVEEPHVVVTEVKAEEPPVEEAPAEVEAPVEEAPAEEPKPEAKAKGKSKAKGKTSPKKS